MGSFINGGAIKGWLQAWYRVHDEVGKSVVTHSCIAGALVLIPCPGMEVAALLVQLNMYRKINQLVGIKFSDHVMEIIGKFLVSQLAGLGIGIAGIVALSVAKFIPGINLLAGLAEAPLVGAINYTCGMAYYKMLGNFIKSFNVDNGFKDGMEITDDEIIRKMKENALSPQEIQKIHKTSKDTMKDVDYKSYRSEAEKYKNR